MNDQKIPVHRFTASLKNVDWSVPPSPPVQLAEGWEEGLKEELKETGNILACCFERVMTNEMAKQQVDRLKQMFVLSGYTVSKIECGPTIISPFEGSKGFHLDNRFHNKALFHLTPNSKPQ